jgi:UDP-glucose 4-epimerase
MGVYLVTGGAGFIGSHIAEALAARGDEVRVLDNMSSGTPQNLAEIQHRVDIISGDVRDERVVADAMQGVECVFHEAALASVPLSVERPLDTHAVCVTGTLNVLHQARQAGVRRVVYAASSSAYGDRPTSSKRETDLPQALSPYAAAKLAGELYCEAFYHTYGLETVRLRYFNIYGPRQDPKSPYSAVIPLFVTKLLAGERPVIYGDGQQSRDFCYVANVVHANLLAATAPHVAGRVINVANGRATSLIELIGQLNAILGTSVEPVHEPPRAGDVRESLADITLARKLLHYEPLVEFEEGLRLTAEYYRAAAGG